MKRKRLSKKNEDFDHTLDESSEESNQSTMKTAQASASAINSTDSSNSLASDTTDSNGTNSQIILSTQASSNHSLVFERRSYQFTIFCCG